MQYKVFLLLYYLLSDPISLDHDSLTQTTQVGFAQRQQLLRSSQERAPLVPASVDRVQVAHKDTCFVLYHKTRRREEKEEIRTCPAR